MRLWQVGLGDKETGHAHRYGIHNGDRSHGEEETPLFHDERHQQRADDKEREVSPPDGTHQDGNQRAREQECREQPKALAQRDAGETGALGGGGLSLLGL